MGKFGRHCIRLFLIYPLLFLLGTLSLARAQSFELRHSGFPFYAKGVMHGVELLGESEETDASAVLLLKDAEGQPLAMDSQAYLPNFRSSFVVPDWAIARSGLALHSGQYNLAELGLRDGAREWNGHLVMSIGLDAAGRAALGSLLEPLEEIVILDSGYADIPDSPLALEGLSALVISGREYIPEARLSAVSAWVSRGGRLVLFGQEREAGIVAGTLHEGRRKAAILGRFVHFDELADDYPETGSAEFWNESLGLLPYEADRGLNIWPETEFIRHKNTGLVPSLHLEKFILIIVLLALLVPAALFFFKKRPFLFIAAASAFTLGFFLLYRFIFGASLLFSEMSARLVLTGDDSAYMSLIFPLPSADLGNSFVIELGERTELILDGAAEIPVHLKRPAGPALYAVKNIYSDGAEIAAWISAERLRNLPESGKRIALLKMKDEERYYTWFSWNARASKWQELREAPHWIEHSTGNDLAWLTRVTESQPGHSWLVGRTGPLEGVGMDGKPLKNALWLIPLEGGGQW